MQRFLARLLLLLVVIVSNVAAMRSRCREPKELTWSVINFESIIRWSMRKCAHPNANYTVETCYSIPGVERKCNWKGNVKWVEYRCSELQRKRKRRFICKIDLDPEMPAQTMLRVCRRSSEIGQEKECGNYGRIRYTLYKKSTFTEPNMSVPTTKTRPYKVDITIQEPTGKFLRYLDKIQYEIMALELHKITNGTTCTKPRSFEYFKQLSVKSAYLNQSINSVTPTQEDHAVSYWSLDGLTPNTTYCVYARYNTLITKNPNGPSQVGVLQVKTAVHQSVMKSFQHLPSTTAMGIHVTKTRRKIILV